MSSGSATPAPVPTIRYVGRFDMSDPTAVRFAWSGSTIIARFKGTGIAAHLNDQGRNAFQVIVDGEPKAIVKPTQTRDIYPLAEGLADGVHEIALYKRTEAEVGEVVFRGFDVTGGSLLPAGPAPERRIEFIGDSITTGYGNEGPGPVCTFNSYEQNHYTTYAGVATRALNAESITIAWSGKTIGQVTDVWDRTLLAKPEPLWSFKSWTPQMVVMKIGTNNFATYDPGEARIVRIYGQLFDKVRKEYPGAFVLGMLGPMLSDNYPEGKKNLTIAKRYFKAAAAKIKERDANFEFVELPEQKHSDGLGCGFHPSVKTHKLMADRVVAVAKEKLGW